MDIVAIDTPLQINALSKESVAFLFFPMQRDEQDPPVGIVTLQIDMFAVDHVIELISMPFLLPSDLPLIIVIHKSVLEPAI